LLWLLKLLLLSNILIATQAFAEADVLRGKVVSVVRCAPCHHLHSSHIKVGPSLFGVFDQAPTISGVPFDVWDEAALQLWLQDSRKVKANTKMVLPHLSERDRNDIIAWLKSQRLP